MNHDNIAVRHDMQHQMFFIKLNGASAHVKYDKPKNDVLNIKETYVPEANRHNGLASHLVKHTLEFARSEGKHVIPSCPFTEDFIGKHAEYKPLVYNNN